LLAQMPLCDKMCDIDLGKLLVETLQASFAEKA